ncbi:FAD:protein FMN transferase [Celerinatantimonas sp. MCCC 1A17872]|uniref:FAD:protein FMN transferase n=1 Tax=Celerinatantimonas sp. MCCC 1A17872 TaxID=3177514 RepID=UPI0038C1BF21
MFKRNLFRSGIVCLLVGLLALLLSSCSKPIKIEKLSGYAQGTTYHISWWSQKLVSKDKVQEQFSNKLASIDKELSTWRDDSYISQFNHSSSTKWQKASKDFINLIELAKDINAKTQGCYDPTIGPLFSLWGFHKDVLHVPSKSQIAAVKHDLGIDKVEVDKARGMIRKTLPGVQLDFSSMGEGYTIGKLSQILQNDGIHNYIVEFGGDMKVKGHKPGGEKWRIAIERPIPTKDGIVPYRIVTINDESGVTIDTSGTYHHSFDEKGKEYSHILDPRTGAPITHDLVSASVFGHEAKVSDAWATAMLCLGPKEGMAVAKSQHLSVFFIRKDKKTLTPFESPALESSKRVTFNAKN